MIGWLNDINRLVSKDKREHHESSQQKTSSRGSASSRPRPPPAHPGALSPHLSPSPALAANAPTCFLPAVPIQGRTTAPGGRQPYA